MKLKRARSKSDRQREHTSHAGLALRGAKFGSEVKCSHSRARPHTIVTLTQRSRGCAVLPAVLRYTRPSFTVPYKHGQRMRSLTSTSRDMLLTFHTSTVHTRALVLCGMRMRKWDVIRVCGQWAYLADPHVPVLAATRTIRSNQLHRAETTSPMRMPHNATVTRLLTNIIKRPLIKLIPLSRRDCHADPYRCLWPGCTAIL